MTDEQLIQIWKTGEEIKGIAGNIQDCVLLAREMKIGRITLTQEQKQALIEEYQTLKQRLPNLYQSLP